MRSKEKFGSSLATVMEKSFESIVVSHSWLASGAPLRVEIPCSVDVDRFFRLPDDVLEPIRNFDMRSFCEACLFG